MKNREVALYTPYLRPDKKKFLEVCDDECTVDQDYMPLSQMARLQLEAGVRLDEYRHGLYHAQDGEEIPDDFVDLLNDPSISIEDVQVLKQVTDERLMEAVARLAKEAAEKKESVTETPEAESKEAE